MSNIRNIRRLPDPAQLVRAVPLSDEGRARVREDRRQIRAILAGTDPRLLVVVGPCSAWPGPAVLEFAARLRGLMGGVEDALKLVLRLYVQKPRTARGWTGPLNQPDPFAEPDVQAGMLYCRRLMVEAIEAGLAIADEALFTHNDKGFAELLSWIAIGARSTEDQEHRIWASAQAAPVGMKNPTCGDVAIGANSVVAAQHPHTTVFAGCQVETLGNPYAHLVLRGGADGPNFRLEDLQRARLELQKRRVDNPVLLVDASHDNCRVKGEKRPERQIEVVREVLGDLAVHRELQTVVKGFLVESFLLRGAQSLGSCDRASVARGGLSITDPCLAWEETDDLLRETAARFREIRDVRVA